MNPKLGIIGSASMVASQACEQFEKENVKLTLGDLNGQNPIDITDPKSTGNFFKKNSFDWAVLFAGYTDVNGAEAQRGDKDGSCWRVNVVGVKNVADACRNFQRKLLFISTDFIFDGTAGPYSEDDPPGPDLDKVGWYGITKIEGEKYIKGKMPLQDFLIVRISFPYSGKNVGKEDFLIKILNLHKDGKLYPMYADQIITPTYIPDVAPAILELLKNAQSGIFHLASPQTTTPHEFAKYLLEKYEGKKVAIEKGKLADQLAQPGTVPRPLLAGLKTKKIAKIFAPTSWQDGIDKVLAVWLKYQT